ncbi:pyruvate dehydrogenase E1 alpha subunit, putative [Trypanosoma equiperdum]|uniref:pyruvate dehydrogenase (acetyl-transferring) n=4 Tax=Trypanozoon TaxID=39700 RepID=Q388X3_TRYB2|nr:pyruvate dehydrogenase E1 component alpha subunit, putative [Trypanosoma brucei gambiense DAL972]XP_823475.1 pyruvate dehydrogenase E1 component subunit alpha [Trypanosoma brucei brucei TREU927]RHW68606.1 pyruvate dehydrogenase E1 alpha subunit [Trypanosoma brucei equiperdum]SCU64219.1 pyruvate dehydrogenase E1 alpha subunit, putative [Trypanosoma equiperdum]EAN78647.1 pyruvate dehydrogenase E1 component alpha subunit, putative [Trypanosoma brucei brucei TREU927]CBH16433.1 pyruvate dehydrog|eukprot:XP_011778697.1 pyruvate dehydrogenase E1 component alpha subunit, putative [Trypanosoma brucei gambiense DAL972]
MLKCVSRVFLGAKTVPLNPHVPFKLHTAGRDDLPPIPTTATYEPEKIKENLAMMIRIRRVEALADQSYKLKKIRGFCHLCIGQEAIPVGMENVLSRGDPVVTGYRDHGLFMTRGGTIEELFAELFGREGGCSKGKGGSMHMYRVKENFYGGNGIVGAQAPLGAGLAWRYALENRDKPSNVAVTFYGDGAANQGQVFEAMNIAALQRIPVIFCCENNHYGMGTREDRAAYQPQMYRRGDYIPGLRVDGMDVLAVQEGTRWAKEWCLAGKGPVVLEMDSYRYMGHSMSDPDSQYRTKNDIQEVRRTRDCIEKMKEFVVSEGIMTVEEIKQMEKDVKKEVDKELPPAEKQAITPLKELFTDIYCGEQYEHRTTQGTVYAKP